MNDDDDEPTDGQLDRQIDRWTVGLWGCPWRCVDIQLTWGTTSKMIKEIAINYI